MAFSCDNIMIVTKTDMSRNDSITSTYLSFLPVPFYFPLSLLLSLPSFVIFFSLPSLPSFLPLDNMISHGP